MPQPCKHNAGGLRSPKEVPKAEGAPYPRCNRADVRTGGVEETPDFAPSAAAPAMATTAPSHIRSPKTSHPAELGVGRGGVTEIVKTEPIGSSGIKNHLVKV